MLEDRNADCPKALNELKRWPKLEHSFFHHQLLFLTHQHHDNHKWNNFESQGQNCPQSHYLNHQIILYVHMQIHFLNKIVGNDLTSICTQILALIQKKTQLQNQNGLNQFEKQQKNLGSSEFSASSGYAVDAAKLLNVISVAVQCLAELWVMSFGLSSSY